MLLVGMLVGVGPAWEVDVDVFGFAAGVLSCRGITIVGEGIGCCAILKLSLVSGCAGTPLLLCPAAHAVSTVIRQRHSSDKSFLFTRNETSLSALLCNAKTSFAITTPIKSVAYMLNQRAKQGDWLVLLEHSRSIAALAL